jgi:molybdate/tungstate transport system substrate-binding protein
VVFEKKWRSAVGGVVAAALMMVATVARADAGDVNVLYAGSLVNVMERSIGPAFEKETGLHFAGYGAGSNKLANEIKGKLRRADVFISASPTVNDTLMGTANGGFVRWYATFAESPLVIGYNPKSRYAAELKTGRWDQVLQQPGIRIGRTDPKLDPKGFFTVDVVTRAARFYRQPDLVDKMLGGADNPRQVLPEEALVGRLQSGQLDAGFFYATETAELHIPSIPLPSELATKASYTVTIVETAANRDGAARFVAFLLGPTGSALLKQHGMDVITPKLTGEPATVPPAVRVLIDAAK